MESKSITTTINPISELPTFIPAKTTTSSSATPIKKSITTQPQGIEEEEEQQSWPGQNVEVEDYSPLSSDIDFHPLSNATITVRVIKSFEYRTFKGLVLKNVDLGLETVGALMERTKRDIKTATGFKAYRNLELDTLKLYTVAHGSKTTNLIINLDKDEWILSDPTKTLAEIGAKNETELSLFNRKEYEAFKANPEVMWD